MYIIDREIEQEKTCGSCGRSWFDKMIAKLMGGQRKYSGYYTYGLMKADSCAMQCDGYRGGSCFDRCMGGSGKTSEYFKPSKPRCKISKHFPEWIRGECCFFC